MCDPPKEFRSACESLGLDLSPDHVRHLGLFLHTLLETNKQFNLTAVRDPDQAWMRHVLDSLSVLPFIGTAETVIDVGSGGGLPGIPLAIVRTDLRVTLLEVTGKKARFLRRAVDGLELANTIVVRDRAETAGQRTDLRQSYDLAVARAIGPMNVLLECTLPLVKVGGRVLAMKGGKAEAELREAGDAIMALGGGEVNVYEALPGIANGAVIVEVVKERLTPAGYPRKAGVPKQDPL